MIESGVSIDEPAKYFIFYAVILIFISLALTLGRRGGCHNICWIAPFMIGGRRLRNLFRWPALHLQAASDLCQNCSRCTKDCPMSLEEIEMVRQDNMEHPECILCGSCVDTCPHGILRYARGGQKKV